MIIRINIVLIPNQYVACLEIPLSLFIHTTDYNSRFVTGFSDVLSKLFYAEVKEAIMWKIKLQILGFSLISYNFQKFVACEIFAVSVGGNVS
jgi:hypothetical protein